MKTEKILIPATITKRLILRLFMLDHELEIKHQNGDVNDHYNGDLELSDDFDYSTHEKIMDKVNELAINSLKLRDGGYGSAGIRNGYELVIAYQILYVTEILDDRSEYRHENKSSEADRNTVTRKIFIYGEPIQKNEMLELSDWVKNQNTLDTGEKEPNEIWVEKGVSFYTPKGVEKVLNEKAELFLKIGEATFAALTDKEDFKPYVSVAIVN